MATSFATVASVTSCRRLWTGMTVDGFSKFEQLESGNGFMSEPV
jgi:hypothetical protein